MNQTKHIYRFNLDCGRMGEITSILVSTPAQIEAIAGKHVNFGEVLGKHSEIYFDVSPTQFTAVTSDELAVEMFEKFGLWTGLDPFAYVDEEEEQEDEG